MFCAHSSLTAIANQSFYGSEFKSEEEIILFAFQKSENYIKLLECLFPFDSEAEKTH